MKSSEEHRRQLAAASRAHNLSDPDFVQLFPELEGVERPPKSSPHVVARSTGSGQPADMQARECWICRDAGPEPLIHPCACRGQARPVT